MPRSTTSTLLAAALLASVACGGGGGPTTAPTPAPNPGTGGSTSSTFSGTSSYNGAGGCSSPSRHDFSAGEGTIVVTLTQASASAARVQVCHPTAANHNTDCTIPPFASVAVGASVSATLKGGRSQTVTVYPDACGRAGTFPASDLSYTVNVSHPR
jgi:hypothetical protein